MKNPWDVFDEIQIYPLTGYGDTCKDCSFAGAGKNDGKYMVLLTFKSNVSYEPYANSTQFYRLVICEDHIAYWRKLVEIHREGQHY